MKKAVRFLCLALTLMFFVPFPSRAEMDLSGYSLDELIALKTRITEEITARTQEMKSVSIPTGDYTVGVDLPAGTYRLTLKNSFSASIVVRHENGETYKFYMLKEGGADTVGKIELQDGQKFEIGGGTLLFSPYKGLGF